MRIRDGKKLDPGSGTTLVTAFHHPISQLIGVHTFSDDIAIYSTPLSLSFVPRKLSINS
jgi:hypothetical protein